MRVLGAVRADPGLAERLKNPCEWLMGFVRNVALQELRKQARRPRLRKRNQITICEYLFPEEDGWQVDRLVQRILDVAPQELTKRELEVITLALDGMSNAEIAKELGISPVTVRVHRSAALRKLRVAYLAGRIEI